ncbi:unnamed protein product [Meloidogyne enterolobii]|uniref:Uncharacterized protein n=1 Tax=Meloidogyne enterolobii TaxID=390850 RepID=A0ACB0XTV7_MELEN
MPNIDQQQPNVAATTSSKPTSAATSSRPFQGVKNNFFLWFYVRPIHTRAGTHKTVPVPFQLLMFAYAILERIQH